MRARNMKRATGMRKDEARDSAAALFEIREPNPIREQYVNLSLDELSTLRDVTLNSSYFKGTRPTSARILGLFFGKMLDHEVEDKYVYHSEVYDLYEGKPHDSVIYGQMRDLSQTHLPKFYLGVGSQSLWKAVILRDPEKPKAWYMAFAKNDPGIGDCVRGFWGPFFEERPGTMLLLAPSLFFRDDDGNFIRSFYCNDEKDRSPLNQAFDSHWVERLQPTVAYVSFGQVKVGFSYCNFFQEHKSRLRYLEGGEHGITEELKGHNLITLGNPRTNPSYAAVQMEYKYRLLVNDRDVSNDGRHMPDRKQITAHEICYHVVVTRCPNLGGEHLILAVGSNHGRGAEGVGEFLKGQRGLSEIYKRLGARSASDPLPRRFQILFKVFVRKEPAETQILRTEIDTVYRYD
jgi:hypothetical protein